MILIIVLAVILYVCILGGILTLCRVPSKTNDHHAQLERQYKAEREKL